MGKVDDDLHTRRSKSKGPMAVKRSVQISQRSNRGSHALPVPDLAVYCRSSASISTWGSKRARSAIGGPSWLPVVLPSPADPTPSVSSRRDWANLSEGPLGLIAERLLADDVVDYLSFRAACRPWRLCSTDPRDHGVLDRRFHPRQWVMLRTEGIGRRYRRRFMNVTTGSCRYVGLPELRGHDVFGPTTEGLLVLLHRATLVVRLLNPFTGQPPADLPPATNLMSQSDLEEYRRCNGEHDLEISGAGLADGDSTVAVYFAGIRTVAVARPGDARWTVVEGSRGQYFSPSMSFAGRFYCATRAAVMVVEIRADQQPPRLAVAAKLPRLLSGMMMDTVHLMDNGRGELMLVDRKRNGSQMPREYKVYRVDLDAGKMVPLRGLGGRAAFIGCERALCVSPSAFPSVRADSIYLGYDYLFTGYLDDSPIDLIHGTSEPRLYDDDDGVAPICGPSGVDHYFSWCVTSYRSDYDLMDRC